MRSGRLQGLLQLLQLLQLLLQLLQPVEVHHVQVGRRGLEGRAGWAGWIRTSRRFGTDCLWNGRLQVLQAPAAALPTWLSTLNTRGGHFLYILPIITILYR